MLIDATHPEETRVVVLRGNRVEEFDFESAHRKQLRGNIYLAKVTRVEPSLQAAFVDYGGNRHGFLAFSEIHPDYYQIPVADRQALIDEEERAQRAADDEIDRRSRRHRHHGNHPAARRDAVRRGEHAESPADDSTGRDQEALPPADHDESTEYSELGTLATPDSTEAAASPEGESSETATDVVQMPGDAALGSDAEEPDNEPAELATTAETAGERAETEHSGPQSSEADESAHEQPAETTEAAAANEAREHDDNGEEEEVVESVGGADAMEEVPDRAPRYRRQYKIQEV
ncbi:MAG: ribonuclease E/G, partial [Xanthobacteraceae bacterium]